MLHLIFNVNEWPLYNGPIVVPFESIKYIFSIKSKSSNFHNEMDVKKGKTSRICGLCKQSGYNHQSCQNWNKGYWTMLCMYVLFIDIVMLHGIMMLSLRNC